MAKTPIGRFTSWSYVARVMDTRDTSKEFVIDSDNWLRVLKNARSGERNAMLMFVSALPDGVTFTRGDTIRKTQDIVDEEEQS